MQSSKKENSSDRTQYKRRVKFEVFGEELVEKIVKVSGKNGRIYLPINWIDRQVKIVRVD